jgi:hypothetical protein
MRSLVVADDLDGGRQLVRASSHGVTVEVPTGPTVIDG